MQATHDLLRYGPFDTSRFDHLEFSGVVPRTFIGPLFIYAVLWPFRKVLGWGCGMYWQYATRAVLGCAVVASVGRVNRTVGRRFGRDAAAWSAAFSAAQFHLMFWGSRTLPNVFALVFVNLAVGWWFDVVLPATEVLRNRRMATYLIFTIAVFRCDVTLLAMPMLLSVFPKTRTGLIDMLRHSLLVSFASIALTLVVDSYFWQRSLWWPELQVFLFNAVENGSVAYGTSPFHAYLTKLVPRICLFGIPLGIAAVATDVRGCARYFLPVVFFVGGFSFLPHKEWRFVLYIVPILNALSGVVVARWARRWGRMVRLVFATILLAQCCASVGMMSISSLNYPGGHALASLNAHLSETQPASASVHLDVVTAISGASRFGEDPRWQYSKREEHVTGKDFWEAGYTHLVTAEPHLHSIPEQWAIVDVIQGYAGMKVHEGGPKSWLAYAAKQVAAGRLSWDPMHGVIGVLLPVTPRLEDKLWILRRQP
ncbi:dolichyl-P-Man:Man(7)GlcNAc(2)-PP-dolichol alpha-1,6-mannosyltransferase [Thoreauomyces humboldtii]|nr:dolichyl-P-Man:Man(7)GlcNAc(2)-PP-dolichol alpha-1,6-mannosyltransferase [Thoreauomyces humboldtii]